MTSIDRASRSFLIAVPAALLLGVLAMFVREGGGEFWMAVSWYVDRQWRGSVFIPLFVVTVVACAAWLTVVSRSHQAFRRDLRRGAVPSRDVGVIGEPELQRRAREMLGPILSRARTATDRVMDVLLGAPVDLGASELRLEPTEGGVEVLLRVGMDSFSVMPLRPALHASIVAQVRLMIAVEDGAPWGEGQIDLRAGESVEPLQAILEPHLSGTRLRLLVLARSRLALPLDKLGMTAAVYQQLGQALRQPSGLVLISAPSGHGVGTTLYAATHYVHHHCEKRRRIASLERRVRLALPFLYQVEATPGSEGAMLSAMLRQGYDVVALRGISDMAATRLALQAARERLVILTLASEDPLDAVAAACASGQRDDVLTTLAVSLGQRLLWRLCSQCRQEVDLTDLTSLTPELRRRLDGITLNHRLYRPRGCAACEGRGFAGRQTVFGVMSLEPWSQSLLGQDAPYGELRDAWRARHGLTPLQQAALEQAMLGSISADAFLHLLDEELT